jgi:hypothetical protein
MVVFDMLREQLHICLYVVTSSLRGGTFSSDVLVKSSDLTLFIGKVSLDRVDDFLRNVSGVEKRQCCNVLNLQPIR